MTRSLGSFVSTDLPDQPWKIARMNKFTYALALGAGLVLSLAAPNAQADPIVQTLTPTPMSASQFNSLYTPSTTVLTSSYDFMNTPNAGVVESQVFTGTRRGGGHVRLRLSVRRQQRHGHVDPAAHQRQQRVDAVQRDPGRHRLHAHGHEHVCLRGDQRSGRRHQPARRRAGNVVQTPSSIAWLPGSTTGSLTFQYLNPTTNTGPLAAGALSGTIVVISTQPFTQQYVSVQNPEPQTLYPKAYSPTAGTDRPGARARAGHRSGLGRRASPALPSAGGSAAASRWPERAGSTSDSRRKSSAAVPDDSSSLWSSDSHTAPRALSEGREGLCRLRQLV